MLIVRYLVKVKGGKLTPGDETEGVKFFDIPELPDYYVNLFRDVIEEIQNGALL